MKTFFKLLLLFGAFSILEFAKAQKTKTNHISLNEVFKEKALEDFVAGKVQAAQLKQRSYLTKEGIEKKLSKHGFSAIKALFQGIIDSYESMTHILPHVALPKDLDSLKGVGADETAIANKTMLKLHAHLQNLASNNDFDLNDFLKRIKAKNITKVEDSFGVVEDLHGGLLEMITNAYNSAKVSIDTICIIVFKLRKLVKNQNTIGDFLKVYHELDIYATELKKHIEIIGIAHQINHIIMDLKSQMDCITTTTFSSRVSKLITDDSAELDLNFTRQFI